jgi:hypothetical protein
MKRLNILLSFLTIMGFLFATSLTCYAQGEVYGCAKKKGGYLRIVTDPNLCKSNETAVTMNQGAAGSGEIKAYDANGQYLGIFIEEDSNTLHIYVPSLKKIVWILLEDGNLDGGDLYFTSSDCSGQPYAGLFWSSMYEVFKNYGKYYAAVEMAPLSLTSLSFKGTDGQCRLVPQAYQNPPLVNVIEGISLPFTLPVALPVRLESTSTASPSNLIVVPPQIVIDASIGGTAAYTINGGIPPYSIFSSHPQLALPNTPTVSSSGGIFNVSIPPNHLALVDTTVIFTVMDSKGLNVSASLTLDVPDQPMSAGIKVYDANNQFLGYSLGRYESELVVYVPSLKKQVRIKTLNGEIFGDALYYTSNNCTGTPYHASFTTYAVRKIMGKYYTGISMAPISIGVNSAIFDPDNICLVNEQTQFIYGVEQIEVTNFPFSTPVALPMRFE